VTTAAVVVERELVRASRRWQTYAQRAGFAVVLFGFVVVYWEQNIISRKWDANTLSQAGKNISEAWGWMQFALLTIVTPVVVAQAIVEEKSARTLELLTTTRLTPRRILAGKLISRMLVLEGLILVGLPVIALCVSLGGVEPLAVANGVLQATAAIVGLGSVAAFLALYANGPIGPAVLTWIWAFGTWFGTHLPGELFDAWGNNFAQTVSPVAALAIAEDWTIVGPLFLNLGVAAATLVLAGRVWATMAAGDHPEDEDLSHGIWAVEGIKRKTGMLFAALAMSSPVMWLWDALTTRSTLRPLYHFGFWLWSAAYALAVTMLWLLICRAAFRYAARPRDRDLGWRRLADSWAAGRDLPHRARTVWGNPVAWREWRTAAHGGFSRWLMRGYVVLGLIVVVGIASVRPENYPWRADEFVFWAFAGFFACALATLFVITSSVAGEQRRRTLDLLRVTGLTPAAVLRGKLIATGVLVAPLVLMSAIVLLPGMLQWADDWRYDYVVEARHRTQLRHLLTRWAATCLWGVSALTFLAVSCQAVALQARTSGRAWIATMSWGVSLVVAPIFVRLLADRSWPAAVDVLGFLNPGLSKAFWQHVSVPWTIWPSAAFWLGLAGLVFFLAAGRFDADRAR